jgi:hypothetical protein
MFQVSPASLQTFTDTPNCVLEDRVQYSGLHSDCFCDGHLQIINCVGIVRIHRVCGLLLLFFFFYCNHHVHRDFLITLYLPFTLLHQVFLSRTLARTASQRFPLSYVQSYCCFQHKLLCLLYHPA